VSLVHGGLWQIVHSGPVTVARRAAKKAASKAAAPPAPADADPQMPSPARTEGQRRLIAAPGSLAAVALAIGCSKAQAGYWRAGQKIPSPPSRAKLLAVYGIPPSAWDIAPGAAIPLESDAEVEEIEADDADPGDTLAQTDAAIASVRRALHRSGLTDAARSKKEDTHAKLLALKARLERDRELVEDRVVRDHPAWLRIKNAICAALEPWPDAAQAVAEALRELEA